MKTSNLVACAMAACNTVAFAAAPTDLATLESGSVVIGDNVSGSFFLDTYTFSLTDPSSVMGGVFPVDISNLTVALLDSSMQTIGTDTMPSDGFSFSGLAAGQYALEILGFPTANAAAYRGVVSAIAAPVPEPRGIALMLGGLGILGFVSRRRDAAH